MHVWILVRDDVLAVCQTDYQKHIYDIATLCRVIYCIAN